MNKRKMLIAAVVLMIGWFGPYTLVAGEDQAPQKKVMQKKRATTSSRHRKGKEPKKEPIQPEAQIENMESYVTEFNVEERAKVAQELLQRGIEYCKDKTIMQVCHTFTHTQEFINGSLYIFLIDTRGFVYAHGDQSELLWVNIWNKHDMFGSPIVQSMLKIAEHGGGSLTYEWDGAVKISFVNEVVIEGKKFIIGCGYFPHSKEAAVIGLVKGAVALFNRHIAEKRPAITSFGNMTYRLNPQFVFGDLYLYALDFNGKIFAQGDRPGLIGSDALKYKDAQGKAYNQEIINMLKDKGKGEGVWIDYISKGAKKRAYAEKVKDDKGTNYFIACGYYPETTRNATIDLVRRGYQFMKGSGLTSAVKEFNNEQENQYRYGDLALFIYDMKGICLADGKNNDLVGQNEYYTKDEDGRFYVREIVEQANLGGGWVNAKINHSFQATYVEKVDLGVGEYILGCSMFPISKPDTMELLVKSAIAYVTGHPMEQFLDRMTDRADEFLRGDLFMYVFDMEGFCYGWSDSYKLIWQNLINWKDDNGKPFVKEMIAASAQGPDHMVLHMNKCTRIHYFEQIEKDGRKYVIGSGFYK